MLHMSVFDYTFWPKTKYVCYTYFISKNKMHIFYIKMCCTMKVELSFVCSGMPIKVHLTSFSIFLVNDKFGNHKQQFSFA